MGLWNTYLFSVFTFSIIQYVCLEQVTSRQVYRTGLDSFPSEVTLLVRSILVDSLCDVSSYPRSEQSMHTCTGCIAPNNKKSPDRTSPMDLSPKLIVPRLVPMAAFQPLKLLHDSFC